MPRQELQYPKQPYSTVKRLNDRGKYIHTQPPNSAAFQKRHPKLTQNGWGGSANYELETIHRLINESRLVSVSFNDPDSPFPAGLPARSTDPAPTWATSWISISTGNCFLTYILQS
ncbi:hypothetical protein V8F06_000432 [Rhypophila decipiens]